MFDSIVTALRRRGDIRVPVATLAIVALYATLAISALLVAVGATAFVWSRVGVYAAAVVGGLVTFALAYVGLQIVDAVTGGGSNAR
jgi:hypothetical protein